MRAAVTPAGPFSDPFFILSVRQPYLFPPMQCLHSRNARLTQRGEENYSTPQTLAQPPVGEHPTRVGAIRGRPPSADNKPMHTPTSGRMPIPEFASQWAVPLPFSDSSARGGNSDVETGKPSQRAHASDGRAGRPAQPINRPSPCCPAFQEGEAACSAPCQCWPWGTQPMEAWWACKEPTSRHTFIGPGSVPRTLQQSKR